MSEGTTEDTLPAKDVEVKTLQYRIRGGVRDGECIWLPALTVKLASQELEAKHRLKKINDQMTATGPFIEELAAKLEVPVEVAILAWQESSAYYAEVQKKTN